MKSTFSTFILSIWILGLLISLPAFVSSAQAQSSVEASLTNTIVYRGESFGLQVVVNNNQMVDVELPVLPELNGVRLLSNVPSRSTNFQIINGRTSSSITYTYTLMASEEGEFTIPAIPVTVDGNTVYTEPISYKVVSQSTSGASAGLPEIFLRIELDDETPVVGQQLVASITLYFRDGTEISSYQPLQGWRADGFWREELENSSQPRAESVLLENQRYRKAVLLRFALFPTRSGELTLAPYGMMLGVRNRSANRDPFGSIFDSFGTNQRRITVESEPVTINVSSLPIASSGLMSDAVGEFRVTRSISQNQITRGEGVEVVTIFEGNGNLPLISRLAYDYPKSFEEYSPQENTDLNRVGTQISGRKIFTELLVAQESGVFEIPAEQIGVYNPKLNRWQTATLPSLTVTVREPAVSTIMPSTSLAPTPGLLDGVLSYQPLPSVPGYLFSNGRAFYLLYLPLLMLGMAIALKVRQRYLEQHSGVILKNSAARRAVKRIQTIQSNRAALSSDQSHESIQIKEVYSELIQIITSYYAERTEQPGRALAISEILKELSQKADSRGLHATMTEIETWLNKLSRISYSPEVSGADLMADLKQAVRIIEQIEEILK